MRGTHQLSLEVPLSNSFLEDRNPMEALSLLDLTGAGPEPSAWGRPLRSSEMPQCDWSGQDEGNVSQSLHRSKKDRDRASTVPHRVSLPLLGLADAELEAQAPRALTGARLPHSLSVEFESRGHRLGGVNTCAAGEGPCARVAGASWAPGAGVLVGTSEDDLHASHACDAASMAELQQKTCGNFSDSKAQPLRLRGCAFEAPAPLEIPECSPECDFNEGASAHGRSCPTFNSSNGASAQDRPCSSSFPCDDEAITRCTSCPPSLSRQQREGLPVLYGSPGGCSQSTAEPVAPQYPPAPAVQVPGTEKQGGDWLSSENGLEDRDLRPVVWDQPGSCPTSGQCHEDGQQGEKTTRDCSRTGEGLVERRLIEKHCQSLPLERRGRRVLDPWCFHKSNEGTAASDRRPVAAGPGTFKCGGSSRVQSRVSRKLTRHSSVPEDRGSHTVDLGAPSLVTFGGRAGHVRHSSGPLLQRQHQEGKPALLCTPRGGTDGKTGVPLKSALKSPVGSRGSPRYKAVHFNEVVKVKRITWTPGV